MALAVMAAVLWPGRGADTDPVAVVDAPAGPSPASPSLAVLPFVDLSEEKDQEYFTDGLTEELLNVLARLEGLRVAARTSAFSFKGKNVKVSEIGRELNVASILEGSVRKSGDQLRITAQLINAADGFHLWSETYDRRLDDIFAVQDDIAGSVAKALEVELLGGETATSPGGTSAKVYIAYLQGRYFTDRHNRDDLKRAIDYYREALALDDAYAPAWAGLSVAYSSLASSFALTVSDESRIKARQAAERALELDDTLAAAHIALGRIQNGYEWDWIGAEASFRRALELAPDDSSAIISVANVQATLGRFDQALELDRRAIQLDPLNSRLHYSYGRIAWFAGRLDEAEAAFKRTLELNPNRAAVHIYLGYIYLGQSRPEEAFREMERERSWYEYALALGHTALGRWDEAQAPLKVLIEGHYGAAIQIAGIYAIHGDADQAFDWLERAYARRDAGLPQIKGNPLLANLEDDPRYAVFLDKLGLPR